GGDSTQASQTLREQIALLRLELNRQQTAAAEARFRSDRRHIDRCELELTRHLQRCRARRDALLRESSEPPRTSAQEERSASRDVDLDKLRVQESALQERRRQLRSQWLEACARLR